MRKMTQRAQSVFDFIVQHKINNDGISPTRREIIDNTDITSTYIVGWNLDILEEAGLIYCDPKLSRAIKVIGGKWTYEENND